MPRDPRIPADADCILRHLLDRWAADTPDKTFVVFGDGTAWSYSEMRRRVRARAAALRGLGVRQDHHVLVWLPNGPQCLVSWFAVNYLGAVYVPINTAYKGSLLAHAVALADAEVAIVHADLLPRLATVATGRLHTVAVPQGRPQVELAGVRVLGQEQIVDDVREPDDADVALDRPIRPWDTQCIVFTSGTTGPSKAVMSSYLHLYMSGQGFPLATAEDRHMVTLPLFHAGGTIPVYLMLSRNGSVALMESFDTTAFWRSVARTGTTTVILLGVMAGFLVRQPETGGSEGTPLRWATALPLDRDAITFGQRFGVTMMTLFNMTEVSCPLVSELNPVDVGSCGHPREGVQARLVDANDCEVAVGEVGELIVRTDTPWAMNHGYYRNAEATAAAWRNGWFHTGDAFRRDGAGRFFFVDRMKDAIRRRGENISSFEVEQEVLAYPCVREAVAVAVPSDLSEDEVLVAVSLKAGQTLDPVALLAFLRERMAHFMVPRYVRVLDELPKTPTQKLEKHLIRQAGITPDTWDRVGTGVEIKRERLSS